MPLVPNVPGVPFLTSYSPATSLILLAADLVTSLVGLIAPQWGIFLNGVPIIDADSVVSFEYKQEWTVSSFPLEQGAFQSYDKVNTPFDVRVRYATGGSDADRQAFLDSIDAVAGSLQLFDVVTPNAVYTSVNITHWDYRRTATNGVGLLVVDIWCIEVRVTATTQFSNTQQPSGADAKSSGIVQPKTPTPQESQELSGLLP